MRDKTINMKNTVDDINIQSLKQLKTPIDLMENTPLTRAVIETVKSAREEAQRIIDGDDDRLLVIVGPCSIHNQKAAIEYGEKLKIIMGQLKQELCIIMRVYFEKPRTRVGWKGLINDPKLNGTFDINHGLKIARQLLFDLNKQGVPTGTEFLDTIIPQYISDLISWGAIGARTTESQIHRELASGLSMPIGFKNGTDGNIDIAVDAIRAASFVHHFVGVTKSGRAAIVTTKANHHCHLILRGAKKQTNFDEKTVKTITQQLADNKIGPRVMVDCSHGNSQKKHENQPLVVDDICRQLSSGSQSIFGVMLESHLVAGKQSFTVGEKPSYNQSITDACLSWDETRPLLERLAQAVRNRRESRHQ